MKRYMIIMLVAMVGSVAAMAQTDIIVLNDGTFINAYNLDYSSADKCYYTLDEAGEHMKSVKKADVMIIKLADGRKIDPSAVATAPRANTQTKDTGVKNPGVHEPVTHKSSRASKKGDLFCVEGTDGQELSMRIVSESLKTLAVAEPRKGLEYSRSSYIIPEYVDIDGDIYTVTTIDKYAFKNIGFWTNDKNIKDIVLPMTLKEIGDNAFAGREGLNRIIIPDSVERIGNCAFWLCGHQSTMFEQLFIPESVKFIGTDAFRWVSPSTSFRGYFQGYLSSIPPYITPGNCTEVGIDEEAVESYLSKKNVN